MQSLNLILHCAAAAVAREQLKQVATPVPTETWHPIGHDLVLDTVQTHLEQTGFRVTGEAHALTQRDNGMRYFGLLRVESESQPGNPDYSWVLGLRNSHDKTFPAALSVGNQVMVCDNLSFHNEVVLARRHTRNIVRDLPNVVSRAVAGLTDRWADMDKRVAAYKDRELTDSEAHDLVIKFLDAGAIPVTAIPDVLKEYRTPRHPEFNDPNAWSLFNAVTECAKGSNVFKLSKRTEALYGVLDGVCGAVTRLN